MYEFDYNSPDDIKNILNRFLKSNFSTEKLTNFIKEVCHEYSELLYFSNKSVNEIRELELVKNALSERYKQFHKISISLENELSNLKASILNGVNAADNKNKEMENLSTHYEMNELRASVEKFQKKAEILQHREEQISSEYESFKTIFIKELSSTRYDLEEVIKQRNNLRDALIEFKNYFGSITNNTFK